MPRAQKIKLWRRGGYIVYSHNSALFAPCLCILQAHSPLDIETGALFPSDIVEVPLGRQNSIGMVWDITSHTLASVAEIKLRPVTLRLPAPANEQHC
jgi:hypothetical protein